MVKYSSSHYALIVADAQSPLATILTQAYLSSLPLAEFINFDTTEPLDILEKFKTLPPASLVVLIQSSSFRLKDFRIRVELFQQSLKVIEHPHLARIADAEIPYYIDSLAYDQTYYLTVGHGLKKHIDQAKGGLIISGDDRLVYAGPFEIAKLNIGDYTDMKNIGGQFPIGEVFTEAQNLESVNGRVRIFAFGDTTFSVNKVERPITLIINKGRVIDTEHSTPEFNLVLDNIRVDEGEVWLRELGFGLNTAFSKHKTVRDIGTYERMCGVHLSLGAKHTVYKKPNFKRGTTWHHVDVFVDTDEVYLDDVIIFKDNAWQIFC